MNDNIRNLLHMKSEVSARIEVYPYDGTPEVKQSGNNKYIYIRKRVGSRLTSTYVDLYSDELYNKLLIDSKELRLLKKELRMIERELLKLGYNDTPLTERVLTNLDFAKSAMKTLIFNQAILEGVATTYPQTETIIDNGTISGMKATDIQKIINLKHAWELILDKDMLNYPTSFEVLSHIAKLVNEGFYEYGGRLRSVPVLIGESNYKPKLPIESEIKKDIDNILTGDDVYLNAIKLCLYSMKSQMFIDGNKRASVIFCNHYLISKGAGLLIISDDLVEEFKSLLVNYYENEDENIIEFMKTKCLWKLA